MKKNEAGVTLVEVLATLILLSMIVLLIWTTFFISAKHNIAETTKLRLQQEANYILTELQSQHRQQDCYKLHIEEHKVSIEGCQESLVISTDYKYEAYAPNETNEVNRFTSKEIKPKVDDLSFILVVQDPKENSKLQVKVETTLSRYKTNQGG